MPRRTLRKIDPRLQLDRYLTTFDRLPSPWDPVTLFGRRAPLEVEIGSGKGLFLASAARRFPQHDFLGIEMARKYARFTAARLAKAELPNARIVSGDAARVLRDALPKASATAVHVYFPDPWWKKRHHKRRIMNERVLRDIERVIAPGGALHFWTDVADYFQQSLELIAAATGLEGPQPVAEQPAEHDLDYRTHFERRVRLAGGTVYRAQFTKR